MPKREAPPIAGSIGNHLENEIVELDNDIATGFTVLSNRLIRCKNEIDELIEKFDIDNKGAQEIKVQLETINKLRHTSFVKSKQLEHKVRSRDIRLRKKMNIIKAKIVVEMYNARQTNFTWGAPTLFVKPSDEAVAEEQEMLIDTSADMLKLENPDPL